MSFPLALVVDHSFRAGKICTSKNGNTFLSEKHRRPMVVFFVVGLVDFGIWSEALALVAIL